MTSDLASTNPGIEIRPGVWQNDFQRASDFLQALHPLSGYWPADESWIFRGHADAEWPLLPAAHRAKPWEPFTSIHATSFDPTTAKDMTRVRRELQLVREFFSAVDASGLSVADFRHIEAILSPNQKPSGTGKQYWPDPELVPILALAQHYGLPTRLLDWSRLGRLAAYFAALPLAEEACLNLAVWALETSVPELRWVGDQAKWRTGTAPRSSNPNLHAQSRLFTYCHGFSDRLRPLDELVSESLQNFMGATKQTGARPCVMRKLVLPREAAKDLMRLLHVDGVSGLTMFPGYAGAARHVQERLWSGMTNPPPAADRCSTRIEVPAGVPAATCPWARRRRSPLFSRSGTSGSNRRPQSLGSRRRRERE